MYLNSHNIGDAIYTIFNLYNQHLYKYTKHIYELDTPFSIKKKSVMKWVYLSYIWVVEREMESCIQMMIFSFFYGSAESTWLFKDNYSDWKSLTIYLKGTIRTKK